MESILINPKDSEELNLITSILAKMKIKNTVLSDEEKEDLGLLQMMNEVDRTDHVSQNDIMSKLRS